MSRRGRMQPVALIGLALGLAAALAAWLVGPGAPSAPKDPVAFITVAEAHRLVREGAPVFFVDVRSRQQYLGLHINGAISVPLDAIDARAREIPRQGLVVLY